MEKDGKLKIVGKDEVRKALGRSPDVADTFLMRMYFEPLKDLTTGTHEQATVGIRRGQTQRKVVQRGLIFCAEQRARTTPNDEHRRGK